MKKAQLTLNDVTDSGFKLLTVLTEWRTVSQIVKHAELSATTIRRLLQRLEAFGLVKEEVQVSEHNPNVSSKHFNLTKDGRAFVKRIQKTRDELKPPVVGTEVTIDWKAGSVCDAEPTPQKEPFNLGMWLRQRAQGLRALADELNGMADDLSVYEE